MELMPKRGLARPVKRLLLWLEEWGLRLVIGLVALTALVVTWQSLIHH